MEERINLEEWIRKKRIQLTGLAAKVTSEEFDKLYKEFQKDLIEKFLQQNRYNQEAREEKEEKLLAIGRDEPPSIGRIYLILEEKRRKLGMYFWKSYPLQKIGVNSLTGHYSPTLESSDDIIWTGDLRWNFFNVYAWYEFHPPSSLIHYLRTGKFKIRCLSMIASPTVNIERSYYDTTGYSLICDCFVRINLMFQ